MAVTIPSELRNAFAGRQVVLFVGAGMSAPQLPGWAGLLERMLAWAEAEGIELAGQRDAIAQLIQRGKLLLAAQVLRERFRDQGFHQFLRRTFRDSALQPARQHHLLPGMDFAAVLTANYDNLIECDWPGRPPVLTQQDTPGLTAVNRDHTFAIVKVHGDVERPESIVLGQRDYRDAIFGNPAFQIFLTNVFTTRTVLFLGCGLADPDLLLFLDALMYKLGDNLGGEHFALMRTDDMNPLERESFATSYGIRILGDPARSDYPDIAGFLEELNKIPRRRAVPAPEPAPQREVDDARGLLEAMGHSVLNDQPAGDCHVFHSQYKSGPQIRSAVTCYAPREARIGDLAMLGSCNAEDGILLTPAPPPETVAQAAKARNLQAYGRDQFIDRLADFSAYKTKLLAEYAKDEIDRYFVPLKIRREVEGKLQDPIALDEFVDAWLDAPERNHLSLLGDFGTGKTWFSRRLAARLAERPGARTAILISLRDYSKAYDIEQVLTHAFTDRFDLKPGAGIKTIHRLNQEGRLLLIFDGFDEMERRVSDYRTALDNFWEIAKLVAPRAKILLTCRTSFFRHRTEEESVLKGERAEMRVQKGEDVIDLRDRREFEVVHLTEFDDGQLEAALRLLSPGGWERLLGRIKALPRIEDLAHRPVLLRMIAETLPAIAKDEDLNLASLYQHYTGKLIERREGTIPPPERQFFVEELAWEMQTTNRLSVPFDEFPDRVTAHFKLKNNEEALAFERDIRSQSYLVRDDAGNYKFAHKSLMEYFVARRIAEALAKGEAPQCPLTDAAASFVYYLLRDRGLYERRIEDGMVWVPPGPFIYGMESESNLRIGVMERGYWIDRFPVTNREYCAFLNEQGNRKEGGEKWLDPGRSRVKEKWRKFEIERGFEDHPVTGVSWYGAAAFARAAGKRLPTEEEWEKAARGMDGRMYPWGENFASERCNTFEAEIGTTTAVGKYGEAGASVYGCEDVAGNVWEWTESLWDAERRVARGGSWGFVHEFAACAFRGLFRPVVRNDLIGFRCART